MDKNEVTAQRVSEARIDFVMLLADAGYSNQRITDVVNAHFNELVILADAMTEWSPRVLAQAMCYRATRDDALRGK